MNYRQLYKRIQNLDRLYLAWDRFEEESRKEETDPEARRGLSRVANGFRRRYDRLVNDRRRVEA